MKERKRHVHFIQNDDAVLGLPLRVMVSLIVGTVALGAILSYILNPCLFPERLVVSVSPMMTTVSSDQASNATFLVHVNDTKSHPIRGARVIIKGLGGAGYGYTDRQGKINLMVKVHLDPGIHEGYLSLSVSAPCHESCEQFDIIKIVKTR
jgi:hypothetical protein